MQKLIDANVILRYLLRDNDEMSQRAKTIIEAGAFTLPEIIAEVVYVLKGVYSVPRDEIADTLIQFLGLVGMENKEVVVTALFLYGKQNLDFVDCILLARHRLLGETVATFDKKLVNYPPLRRKP